ncbi:MAG: TraB/GumN family protein [Bacteroidota bacterium]
MKSINLKKVLQKSALFALAFLTGMLIARVTRAQDNSLLWKVSGNGLEKPSYVYGTIHIICPDDFLLTEETKEAVAESEQIIMELDFDDPEMTAKFQQLSVSTDGLNLKDHLDEAEHEMFNTFFKSRYGITMDQLGVMKPIALLSMVLPAGMDCAQPASYELSFLQMKGEKEILGLETVEYQIGVFDEIKLEEQVGWLKEYIGDLEILKSEFDEMTDVYLKQDVEELHDLVLSSPQFSDYADALLYKRNANWIPKLEEMMKEKSSFIAVGAGHLGSDKGVLALLKAEGYDVSPLQSTSLEK